MTLVLLVAVAAGVGACLRHVVDVVVQARRPSPLPWGTFTVNVCGSLLLGVVVGLAARDVLPHDLALVLSVGLAGGFTTLSTWAWETRGLWASGARRPALLNVVGTHAVCLAAAALGLLLSRV